MDAEKAGGMIRAFSKRDNSNIFIHSEDGMITGHVTCIGGEARRNHHAVKLVIGVLEKYQGQGIATNLLKTTIQWAKEQQLHRLELLVMAHNDKAIALYKKVGFQMEGTKLHSLKVDGKWVDEHLMCLLLD